MNSITDNLILLNKTSIFRAGSFLFFSLIFFYCPSSRIWADGDKSGSVIILRVGEAKLYQFQNFIDIADDYNLDVVDFHIPMNLWTNHNRDWENLGRLIQDTKSPLIPLGYSIGGKFAARLARDNPKVRASFLLDPTDGGAPLFPSSWPNMPVFMDSPQKKINKLTWVIKAEYGDKSGRLGLACVNKGLGAKHFASFVESGFLKEKLVKKAGHLEMVLPPDSEGHSDDCPGKFRDDKEIHHEVIDHWQAFLSEVFDS